MKRRQKLEQIPMGLDMPAQPRGDGGKIAMGLDVAPPRAAAPNDAVRMGLDPESEGEAAAPMTPAATPDATQALIAEIEQLPPEERMLIAKLIQGDPRPALQRMDSGSPEFQALMHKMAPQAAQKAPAQQPPQRSLQDGFKSIGGMGAATH